GQVREDRPGQRKDPRPQEKPRAVQEHPCRPRSRRPPPMILYRPTDGDVQTTPSPVRPRSCFIMTQLGGAVPPSVTEIRSRVEALLASAGYTCFDADSVTQGRDFLIKIWELAVSAPVGIAIIDQQMP